MSLNDESDRALIFRALNMWANYIETNDICMSSVDASNSGQQHYINPLTTEQMEFIVRLRKLASKTLSTN